MDLYYDFEFSSARVIIITFSFVWGSLVLSYWWRTPSQTYLVIFPLRGICQLFLLVWGGSSPLSFVAAVAAATATTAAAYVVVAAAIGIFLASF